MKWVKRTLTPRVDGGLAASHYHHISDIISRHPRVFVLALRRERGLRPPAGLRAAGRKAAAEGQTTAYHRDKPLIPQGRPIPDTVPFEMRQLN
jgi:hypothetical protein